MTSLRHDEEVPMRSIGWSVAAEDGQSSYGIFPTRERAEEAAARMREFGTVVHVQHREVPDEKAALSLLLRSMARRATALRRDVHLMGEGLQAVAAHDWQPHPDVAVGQVLAAVRRAFPTPAEADDPRNNPDDRVETAARVLHSRRHRAGYSHVCDRCRGDARAVAAALTATEETR